MVMTASDNLKIKSALRAFINSKFLLDNADPVGDEESFLEKGIIDSTGILELVSHLEETYGIKIDDTELIPDNLDSLNRLTEFILRKKAQSI